MTVVAPDRGGTPTERRRRTPQNADGVASAVDVLDLALVVATAQWFVDAGRVVPGVTRTKAGVRSQWWPLPAAADRELLRGLLADGSPESHRAVSEAIADATDVAMRTRLGGVSLLNAKPGRRSVPECWLASLTANDPFLPASLPHDKVDAFIEAVEAWVRAGCASATRTRVVLRFEDPTDDTESASTDSTGGSNASAGASSTESPSP